MSVNPPDDKKPPEPSPLAKGVIVSAIVLGMVFLIFHFFSGELQSMKNLVMRLIQPH